jgi:hypothetical protein
MFFVQSVEGPLARTIGRRFLFNAYTGYPHDISLRRRAMPHLGQHFPPNKEKTMLPLRGDSDTGTGRYHGRLQFAANDERRL